MELIINSPDSAVLNSAAAAFLDSAKGLRIDSDAMYQVAADELRAIKAKNQQLEDQRTNLVAPLNKVVKDINAMFKPPMEFLSQAEGIIKLSMIGYQNEQERKRREEEARARAAAEAEAAKARAKIEQERAAAEEKARIERERIEQERKALIASGDTVKAARLEAKAEAITEAAQAKSEALAEMSAMVAAAPVIAHSEAPKAAGVSTRSVWKCECADKMALIKFIANNPQFENLLEFNESAGNQMAKALKGTMRVDGLRVFEDKVLASRRAA